MWRVYFYSCIDTDLMSYIFWDVITTDTFLEGIHFISVQLVARIEYLLSLTLPLSTLSIWFYVSLLSDYWLPSTLTLSLPYPLYSILLCLTIIWLPPSLILLPDFLLSLIPREVGWKRLDIMPFLYFGLIYYFYLLLSIPFATLSISIWLFPQGYMFLTIPKKRGL